jgi:hypothetical protein
MDTHVKVLGVFFIVLSAIGLMAALLLALVFTAATGIVSSTADAHGAAIALPLIGLTGMALVTFLLILAVPGLVTGIGLLKLKPWARICGIVLSAMHLIHIPFGTILGIYGLWVLLNQDTERLFRSGATAIQTPSA